MIKFLWIAGLIIVAVKLVTGRWLWDYLRPPPTRKQALFRARKLLGVSDRASHGEIIDAHRKLITLVHPDRGGSNDQVHEANAARDLLLDELPERQNLK